MKSNTLAIAVASLLIGGVATAAYMNTRNQAPDATEAADATDVAVDETMLNDRRDGDTRIAVDARADEKRFDYAEVVAVEPVTRSDRLYATVIGTEPVRETTTAQTPREICEDVTVQERMPERDGNVGGTVAGAVIGGLLGNQIGDGDGRKAATVAGAAAGGYIGNRVDKRHEGGKVIARTDRQCRTVYEPATSSRTVAWNVTYRNPDGSTGRMRTEQKPGKRIPMGTEKSVIGYDVTYRYEGRDHQLRMGHKPGPRLPVIGGQVVTEVATVGGADRG